MPDTLHIPQKQFKDIRPKVREAVRRHTSRFDPVMSDELQSVLENIFQEVNEPLRQNWLEIERWTIRNPGIGGASLYDAIIDPAQTTADKVNHIYPNLASVVANESWGSTYVFCIGVVARPSSVITENAAVTVPGPVSITALGIGGPDVIQYHPAQSVFNRPHWSFSATVSSNFTIFLEGLKLYRASGTQTRFFISDGVMAVNCIFSGLDVNQSTRLVSEVTNGPFICIHSSVHELSFSNDALLIDSLLHYGDVNSDFTISTSEFFAVSCVMDIGSSSRTYTFSGADVYLDLTRASNAMSAGGGTGIATFSFTGSTASIFLRLATGFTRAVNVTSVGATVDNAVIEGVFNNITISGNSDKGSRMIRAELTGTLDVTGPAYIDIDGRSSSARILCRGSGIRGNVRLAATGNAPVAPALDLIGCDDSLIVATLFHDGVAAGSSKPYAIDAASDRSILIVSGSRTGWSTSGTNSSSTCLVIDELGPATVPLVAGNKIDITGLTIDVDGSEGKSGGDSYVGGSGADENLTFESTTHATKGKIILGPTIGDQSVIVNGSEEGITIAGIPFATRLAVHDEGTQLAEHLAIHKHSDTDSLGAHMVLAKSGGTEASETVVASGEVLGRLSVVGFDGTDYAFASWITFEVDGTPGSNDMPGRIVFATTADGAGAPVNRWKINNSGQFVGLVSGGGTIYGGEASGDDLTIGSTSHSVKGSIITLAETFELMATDYTFGADAPLILCDNTYTFTASGYTFRLLLASSILVNDDQTGGGGLSAHNIFNNQLTLRNSGSSVTNLGIMTSYVHLPTLESVSGSGVCTMTLVLGFRAAPITINNATSLTITNVVGVRSGNPGTSGSSVATGVTATTWTHYHIQVPSGSGTIGTQYGLDIPQFTNTPTTANVGIRNASATVFTPLLTTVSGASVSITPTGSATTTVVRLNNTSGGAVTLTSTPTIANGIAGQILIIYNSSTNTVTFQRESALAGSNLRLGAATRTLGQYDTLTLMFDGINNDWVELAFVDNT